MKRLALLLLFFFLPFLPACTAPAAADGGGRTGAFEPGTTAHPMPMFGEPAGVAASAAGDASTTRLRYYGGRVLAHPNVVTVFWGGGVDPSTRANVGGFYEHVLQSPYLDWLSEYDTDIPAVGGGAGTNQHLGRGSFAGAVTISPARTSGTIDDQEIQTELDAQIRNGALPAPGADTLYMTYFPKGMSITESGSSSCREFCAYHGTFRHGGKAVAYGVVPDQAAGTGCDMGCGAGSAFDRLTTVSSHELVEAITDADVGLATSIGKPLAWYDTAGGEIGDLCAGSDGTIDGYSVQTEWDNASSRCILSKGDGAAADFALALDPASVHGGPGGQATLDVVTSVIGGDAGTIALSISGLPAGVTADIAPPSIIAGDRATVTFSLASDAAAGTTDVVVRAAGDGVTHTATATLTVDGASSGIANGGFEGSLAGWTLGGAKLPIDSSAQAHGGSRAMRLGATTTQEPDGDSWAEQAITLPADASSARLTFWRFSRSEDTSGGDWQEAEIRAEDGTVLSSIFHETSDVCAWSPVSVDLTPWRGRTVVIRFDVHGDGGTTPTSMWIDDVTVATE